MKTESSCRIGRSPLAVNVAMFLLAACCGGCTLVPQFKEPSVTTTPRDVKVVLVLDSAWLSSRYVGGVWGEPHTFLLGEALERYATSATQKSFRDVIVVKGEAVGTNAPGAGVVLRPVLERVQTVEHPTTAGGQKAILVADWTATNPNDGRVLWKGSIDAEGNDSNYSGARSIRTQAQFAFEQALNSLYVKTVSALGNAPGLVPQGR
jgi:hypothetical protein